MHIYTKGTCDQKVLYLHVSTKDEQKLLDNFTRGDEPLIAIVKKSPGYVFPHIEIRREQK